MSTAWYHRFLNSTRGRVVAFLRRETHTVDEMASALHLTDNAVRSHLAALERDGLVEQHGVRRGGGVGKPAYSYALTPDAEQLFPKPYAVILGGLLDSLGEQLPSGEIELMLRRIGNQIAQAYPAGRGDDRARLGAAVQALNQLGGLAELQQQDGEVSIQGFGCPMAALVPAHPEICHLAEAFVSEVAGLPVRECCNRDSTPRCHFQVIEQPCEQP